MLGIVIIGCWLAIFWHTIPTLGECLRPQVFSNYVLIDELEPVNNFSFLTVGDWGRKGLFNQSLVAHQMGEIGEKMGIRFVISTGDNFYDDGLKSPQDSRFFKSFKNIYTAESLQVPWFIVLGNHDYRGDVSAQIGHVLPSIDKRWFCRRNYLLKTDLIDIFFIDTTPFVKKYFGKLGFFTYDWRGVKPRKTYIQNVLMDLEKSIKTSSARWKMVVGHHPIISTYVRKSETKELVASLLPILEENGVDIYMNGHNHFLEHLTSNTSSIQFFTSGAGSKIIDFPKPKKLQPKPKTPKIGGNLKYYYGRQGFMSVYVSQSYVKITFFDVDGRALYNASLLKN